MKTHKSKHWQVKVPDDWQVEVQDECEILYQNNGIGELHISATLMDEDVSDETLVAMVQEHLESGADAEEVDFGLFDGLYLDYEADGEYWREWYLRSGLLLLFISYVCEQQYEGEEDDVVEMMLESLQS